MKVRAGVVAHRLHVANVVDRRFDGDMLNLELLLDIKSEYDFERLKPALYAFDVNQPRKVSKYLDLEPPVVTTIDNWIDEPIDYPHAVTSDMFH